jgi:hypothetical protein
MVNRELRFAAETLGSARLYCRIEGMVNGYSAVAEIELAVSAKLSAAGRWTTKCSL